MAVAPVWVKIAAPLPYWFALMSEMAESEVRRVQADEDGAENFFRVAFHVRCYVRDDRGTDLIDVSKKCVT